MGCFVTWYHSTRSPTGLSAGVFPAQSGLSGAEPYFITSVYASQDIGNNFKFITFNHIPRNKNSLTDAYANYILDWHLTHLT